ncbi:MAG: Hpt domain-containing protein [Steroidobacteraceae bacterium]|nr:Hpt domain-containing protein [Steroidobacteraceae bacterium]
MRDETATQRVLQGVRSRFLQRSMQELQSAYENVEVADSAAWAALGDTIHRIAATATILELKDVAERASALELLMKAAPPGQPAFDLSRLRLMGQQLNEALTSALASLGTPEPSLGNVPGGGD